VTPKARALAELLAARDDLGAELVELRSNGGDDWVLANLEIDVGQLPANDIRSIEPVAIGFSTSDSDWPSVMALRPDFPRETNHQFIVPAESPASLCLLEQTWSEGRRRWTPAEQVRLARTWFIDTARGALHRGEQAVEPFLPGSSAKVILPADAHARASAGEQMEGAVVPGTLEEGRPIIRLSFDRHKGVAGFIAAAIRTKPVTGGIIHRPPRTLAELLDLCAGDSEFALAIDALMGTWTSDVVHLKAHPLIFVQFPTSREDGGEVERIDAWCFIFEETVETVAVALGLWSLEGGGGKILPWSRPAGPYGSGIRLNVANPVASLDGSLAAAFNGRSPSGLVIAAVGAGALGSQVLLNLARMGEAPTAVIDDDRLMPHNLARHAAWSNQLVGWQKSEVARWIDAEVRHREEPLHAFSADVTKRDGEDAERTVSAIKGADMVLDMAAAIAVSRRLALDDLPGGRRVSAFLSPTGADLVVLAENRERTARLDHLEMAYYAAVAQNPALGGHFELAEGRRYARSCREVSSQIPQTSVAIHAAIATDAILKTISSDEAMAAVWRIDTPTMAVTRIEIDSRPMREFIADGWTLLISAALLDELERRREAHLPAETGGVLVGDFDLERQIVYIVADIKAPADSVETTTGFVRGTFGLGQAVTELNTRTHGALDYVGEWHSHPEGVAARPSGEDVTLYEHMAEAMRVEGRPPVMIIVGGESIGVVMDGRSAGRVE
jgi:hypothetical protein